MYYIIINNTQQGPYTIEQLTSMGIAAETMVWTQGMPDWQRADTIEELQAILPPQYRKYAPYGPQPEPTYPYYYSNKKSQWMTLSIVATVLGLCSCIGLILGIIAITKCSTANNLYQRGDEIGAQSADENAKIMCFVALGFDALGMIASSIIGTFNNF